MRDAVRNKPDGIAVRLVVDTYGLHVVRAGPPVPSLDDDPALTTLDRKAQVLRPSLFCRMTALRGTKSLASILQKYERFVNQTVG